MGSPVTTALNHIGQRHQDCQWTKAPSVELCGSSVDLFGALCGLRWTLCGPLWEPLWTSLDPLRNSFNPLWASLDPLWTSLDPLWTLLGFEMLGSSRTLISGGCEKEEEQADVDSLGAPGPLDVLMSL